MKDQPPTIKDAPGVKRTAAKPKSKKKAAGRRGTPKGRAVIEQPHGGRIGNPPFQPTEEQREQVRTYAKCFPVHAEESIATLMGISRSTLRLHFEKDLKLARAQMCASIGAQMINRAMDANNQSVKGDIEAQKYVLARLCGWTTKVDARANDGPPAESIDLSGMSAEALREYGRNAAIAEGLDPDEVVGPSLLN